MTTEYVLPYTGSEIQEKLAKVDALIDVGGAPTKVSELENDSGFITYADADSAAATVVSDHNTDDNAHSDMRLLINNLESSKADATHEHSASNITSGTIDIDRLPKATAAAAGVVHPLGHNAFVTSNQFDSYEVPSATAFSVLANNLEVTEANVESLSEGMSGLIGDDGSEDDEGNVTVPSIRDIASDEAQKALASAKAYVDSAISTSIITALNKEV